jgi:hypothetical protein
MLYILQILHLCQLFEFDKFDTTQKWPQLTSVTNIDSPKGVKVIPDWIKFTHTFSVEIKFSF